MMQLMIFGLQGQVGKLQQELGQTQGMLKQARTTERELQAQLLQAKNELRLERRSHAIAKTEVIVCKTATARVEYHAGRKVAVARRTRKSQVAVSPVCSSTQDVCAELECALRENVELKEVLSEWQGFFQEEEAACRAAEVARRAVEAQVQQLGLRLALKEADLAFHLSKGQQLGGQEGAAANTGSVCSSCKSPLASSCSSTSLSSSLDGPALGSCSPCSTPRRTSCSSSSRSSLSASKLSIGQAAALVAKAAAALPSRIPSAPGVVQAAAVIRAECGAVVNAPSAAKAPMSSSKASTGSRVGAVQGQAAAGMRGAAAFPEAPAKKAADPTAAAKASQAAPGSRKHSAAGFTPRAASAAVSKGAKSAAVGKPRSDGKGVSRVARCVQC